MLDSFLEVALRSSSAEQEKRAFINNLKKLPDEELKKLASGELKMSHYLGCADNQEWLEKYKGTPLFEQAVALEQQDIQNEASRVQSQLNRPPPDQFWQMGDQIRLQKRLLDLQLLQSQVAPPTPEAPAQGAGAPGAGAANNEEAMSPGPDNGMKISAAVEKKAASVFADLLRSREGALGRPFDKVADPAALMARLVAGAKKVVPPIASKVQGAVGGGLGGLGAAVASDAAEHMGPKVLEKAVGLGKEKGLGRFTQLLSGSRADLLDKLHRGAGAGATTLGSETGAHLLGAGASPVAKALEMGHEALGPELQAERMKSLIARGALGAGVGGVGLAALAHGQDTDNPHEVLHQIRTASAEKVAMADSWGRDLARQDADKLEKVAIPTNLGSGIQGGLKSLGAALGKANTATGGRLGMGALAGAGVGALGGLATGAQRDEHGETHMLRNMLGGAALGGGVGAVGGNVAHQMSKGKGLGEALTSGVQATGRMGMGVAQSARKGFNRGAVMGGIADTVKDHAASLAGLAGAVPAAAAAAEKYGPQIKATANKALEGVQGGISPLVEGARSALGRVELPRFNLEGEGGLGARLRSAVSAAPGVVSSAQNLMNNARAAAAAA